MIQAAKFLAKCTSDVIGCHLELSLSPASWKVATAKAKELDISKGDIPGLYPYRWQLQGYKTKLRSDSNEIIFYFYDFLKGSKVGFLVYFETTEKVHIGIFDTKDKQFQSISQGDLFSLNITFSAELLGIVNAKYQVQVGQ